MYVLLAGLNHRTAPVEIRERFVITGADLLEAYSYFKNVSEINGVVILATCNRTEIYATARDIQEGMQVLENFMINFSGFKREELHEHMYQPNCFDAISHLFKVAAGLDSMIIGEAQILAQVKEAYQMAVDAAVSDGVLNALFQKAIYVGKKVRTDTNIDNNCLSISYAAVELARKTLGVLQNKTVLVVGAGEMSELATKYLMQNGVKSVLVSNRSYDKAVKLAQEFDGRAVKFDDLPNELIKADIVISCTSANHYVIREDNCGSVLRSRSGRKIIIIDIAVPRDVQPELHEITGVIIYDIDDLNSVVEINYLERLKAAKEAEKIVEQEMINFNEWLAALYVVPVIKSLKAYGENIKQNELRKAFNRLKNLSEQDKKVISAMAHAIVNQFLHSPMVNLKEMAVKNQGHLYAEVTKKLFALDTSQEENTIHE